MSAQRPDPDGISRPSVDHLTAHSGGRYQLSVAAARRTRQLVAFYGQLDESTLLEYTGPVVAPRRPREALLSIALREISDGLITIDHPGIR